MVRTQIQLTEEQFEAVRERASAEGRSMADVIRNLVDQLLASGAQPGLEERRRRAIAAIGCLGKKGPRDIARRHDDYLAKAFE